MEDRTDHLKSRLIRKVKRLFRLLDDTHGPVLTLTDSCYLMESFSSLTLSLSLIGLNSAICIESDDASQKLAATSSGTNPVFVAFSGSLGRRFSARSSMAQIQNLLNFGSLCQCRINRETEIDALSGGRP